jgi:hypothetical protein
MSKEYAEMVETIVIAVKESDLDCADWDNVVLVELAEIIIKALAEKRKQ